MATEPILTRTVAAAGCLILLGILTGCGLFGGDDDTDASTCGDRDWCYYVPGEGHTDGAYEPVMATLYCQVEEVRQRVVDGELDVDDLPEWAETDDRNGAPIVIDLAMVPTADFAKRQDDLRSHFEDIAQPLDYEEIETCADELTQPDIESTDGKRRAG